uniref:Methyltransferase domain-containing protein n=1 Tax=Candidatus Kentrum sp. FW TaxID=2126338 RepID=A0A450TRF9_9GAMM|nr:MAG: Methyltransferase domain-containing protein [Candidatus Kentron sp. FW]
MNQPDLFQEKAEGWDADDRHRALSSAVGNAILQHVSFDERMHVMDFGAGTGLISAAIAPLAGKVTALDTSEAMLEKLVAKPELRGRVEAVFQDITDKPLGIKFDRIVSAMAMHHVQDTHRLIRAFAEHLKPGAVIALADLDKEDGTFHPEGTPGVFHHGFDRHGFRAILEEHGFWGVRFITAHSIPREGKEYPVFLCVATKEPNRASFRIAHTPTPRFW